MIAYEYDAAGAYGDVIDGVLSSLSSNDARCEGAQQQVVNGAYRCVELLAIVAYQFDTSVRV